jgi:predicted phosphohydrolase
MAGVISKAGAFPGTRRVCVDVTNKCDLSYSNCTRLLKNQDGPWEMTPEDFRKALKTLVNFPGMIAMIGGNPCVHSQFEELCRIFQEEIPDRRHRGLWTNNIFQHGAIIEDTFGGLNLNPHDNPKAKYKREIERFEGEAVDSLQHKVTNVLGNLEMISPLQGPAGALAPRRPSGFR